jgi:hypothetical protein
MIFFLVPLLLSIGFSAQQATKPQVISHPTSLVADSQDNLLVLMKYGIAKVTPAGVIIDLRKLEGGSKIDKGFGGLVIDSRTTSMPATRLSFTNYGLWKQGRCQSLCRGKGYGLVDGPLATANSEALPT